MVSQILFIAVTIAAIALFSYNLKKIIRNIRIGKAANRSDQPHRRFMTMLKVALGQTKMLRYILNGVLDFQPVKESSGN